MSDPALIEAIDRLTAAQSMNYWTSMFLMGAACMALIVEFLLIHVMLRLKFTMGTLVTESRALARDLELMLDNMGWSTGEHTGRMQETMDYGAARVRGDDDASARKAAVLKRTE